MRCTALFGAVLLLGPLAVAHAAATLATLASFDGINGANPDCDLIADAAGNLYGTTAFGGANNDGTVFEVLNSTHAIQTLATFNGGNGSLPVAGLIFDAAGNLYGTTETGGDGGGATWSATGTVFEVATGNHALTTLASFNGKNGGRPQAKLFADGFNNLYGTTTLGGAFDLGTVFQLAAESHALTTLAHLNFTTGAEPFSNLIADGAGFLYGTTSSGLELAPGNLFKINIETHALSTLATFNGINGQSPDSGLIQDAAGNLYGTTVLGGASNLGTVYKFDATTHAITTLATFYGTNGDLPECNLIADAAGNLYGTTFRGGANGLGTVFKIDGKTHSLVTLVTFDGTYGEFPVRGLIADKYGSLYGTTDAGGPNDLGTVFRISGAGFVPEPSTAALLVIGCLVALGVRRR